MTQPNEKLKDSNRLLVGNSVYLPPEEEEIEVSLFGPGYGESVLLHIGSNKWIIVDSCIDPVSEMPAPLSYLRKINIDPGEAVKQVIATHWHDDHIRGLSIILKECKLAEFVCSVAQTSKEFLTLIGAYGTRSMMESTGVNEFYEILKILQHRNINQKSQFYSPEVCCCGPMFMPTWLPVWRFKSTLRNICFIPIRYLDSTRSNGHFQAYSPGWGDEKKNSNIGTKPRSSSIIN